MLAGLGAEGPGRAGRDAGNPLDGGPDAPAVPAVQGDRRQPGARLGAGAARCGPGQRLAGDVAAPHDDQDPDGRQLPHRARPGRADQQAGRRPAQARFDGRCGDDRHRRRHHHRRLADGDRPRRGRGDQLWRGGGAAAAGLRGAGRGGAAGRAAAGDPARPAARAADEGAERLPREPGQADHPLGRPDRGAAGAQRLRRQGHLRRTVPRRLGEPARAGLPGGVADELDRRAGRRIARPVPGRRHLAGRPAGRRGGDHGGRTGRGIRVHRRAGGAGLLLHRGQLPDQPRPGRRPPGHPLPRAAHRGAAPARRAGGRAGEPGGAGQRPARGERGATRRAGRVRRHLPDRRPRRRPVRGHAARGPPGPGRGGRRGHPPGRARRRGAGRGRRAAPRARLDDRTRRPQPVGRPASAGAPGPGSTGRARGAAGRGAHLRAGRAHRVPPRGAAPYGTRRPYDGRGHHLAAAARPGRPGAVHRGRAGGRLRHPPRADGVNPAYRSVLA